MLFIPIIYVYYPETAGEYPAPATAISSSTENDLQTGRSLEEIDIIFALAYVEKRSYVEVAKNMPSLTNSEIESESHRLGLDANIDEETLRHVSRPAVVSEEKGPQNGN